MASLAPGNIQENSFIPEIGMKKATFWQQNKARAEKHEADEVLSYMTFMLERASAGDVPVRRQDFARHGKTVPLFRGAADWFDRVNARSRERHVKLQHYIISSGIKEMIEATKIGKKFTKVFASSFAYDANGAAKWPALAINYTTKTQYLFRINKGSLSVHDHGLINDFVPHEDRPMPFSNIVFIGDGDTDIPCMRLVEIKAVIQSRSINLAAQRKRPAPRNLSPTSVPILLHPLTIPKVGASTRSYPQSLIKSLPTTVCG
jgi:hypothetical protein